MKSFHHSNLERIKKVTGATFAGFVRYKDSYQLILKINGEECPYKLHGTPDDVTQDSYNKLLATILSDKFGIAVENKEI